MMARKAPARKGTDSDNLTSQASLPARLSADSQRANSLGPQSMAVIQCTKKLLTELKVEDSGATIPTSPLGSWHANLLTLDRRKCVLFTNDLTRYSFLVTGLRKPDFQVLDEVFRQSLFKSLINDGFNQEQIEKVLDEIREISFTKTSSRSVLGSMNDIADIIKWTLPAEGGLANTDTVALMKKMNRMLMKPIGYKYAVEVLREALG